MIQHLINGVGLGIGQVGSSAVSVEPEFARDLPAHVISRTARFDHSPRHANHRRISRHFLDHDRVGTNTRVIAHLERPQHLRASADHHVVTEGRMTLALVPTGAAEGDPLIQGAVVADLGGFADHDAHAMINEKPPADSSARMNLDPGQPAGDSRQKARQPFQAQSPQRMVEPMEQERMNARIGGENLKYRARRRIAVEYGINVFPQTLPKRHDECVQTVADGGNRTARSGGKAGDYSKPAGAHRGGAACPGLQPARNRVGFNRRSAPRSPKMTRRGAVRDSGNGSEPAAESLIVRVTNHETVDS